MNWLTPLPEFQPRVRSLESFFASIQGCRLIFNWMGEWTRLGDFASQESYRRALRSLTSGAAVIVGAGGANTTPVSQDPFGETWIEWLRSLRWDLHEGAPYWQNTRTPPYEGDYPL